MFNLIKLRLKPSRPLALAVATPFAANIGVVVWLNLPTVYTVLLILSHLAAAFHLIRLFALNQSANSIIAFQVDSEDFLLLMHDGRQLRAQIGPDSLISRFFSMLHFDCLDDIDSTKSRSPRLYALLTPWNIQSLDPYRRLRVRLRFDSRLTHREVPS